MTAECINDIGLLLDIFGAVLLFKFGLPPSIDRTGNVHLLVGHADEDEIKKGKLYDRWGMIGLILLILGFSFQLASNHITN